jgi:superfamily II DNA or RNA helicase
VAHCRHGVVEAVTGTGKTRVGLEAVNEAMRDDRYVAVVCVPTKTLMHQWARELRAFGIRDLGLRGDGHSATCTTNRVVVSVVNSLRNAEVLRGADRALLVADECHRYGASTFQLVLDPRYTRRLGLTATYERSDDGIKDLDAFFGGSPIFSIGYDRAIRDAVVAHYVVMLVGVDFNSEEREQYEVADRRCRGLRAELLSCGLPQEPFGIFMEAVAALSKDQSNPLSGLAAEYLRVFVERRRILASCSGKTEAVDVLAPVVESSNGALLFTQTIASSERAAGLLRAHGIAARAVHSEHSSNDRDAALGDFRRGHIKALVAPTILDEGVDVPDADLGVVIATTSSRRQMIQRMGRVLRLKPNYRRGRFVILYVRNTAEDPNGPGRAHEAFLDMVTDHADAVETFDVREADRIRHFATHWAG